MANSLPPHSIETEMAIIGSVLVNKSALNYCIINIEANYFYDKKHALIWKVISALYSENKAIDEVTIKNWIDINKLDKSNILQIDYVIQLSGSFPVAYNIQEYVEILIESYQKRQIQTYFQEKYREITKEGKWEKNLNEIQTKFFNLTNEFLIGDNSNVEIKKVSKKLIEGIASRGNLSGVLTGYLELDRLTGGFQESNIIIIAGVTTIGKTSFALNICANMLEENKSIMFVSLEMSSELLVQRLFSSEANVNSYKIKQHTISMPKLDATDWANLHKAADKFKGWELTICDRGNYTVQNIRGLAKQKQHSKNGLDIIFIDYLQLLSNSKHDYRKNRNDEIATITRELKLLAMELKIPIVLLSQLNREASKRGRPVLSNLKDSGAIEQDADLVMFIHSEDYYDEDNNKNNIWDMEIILAKQRNGPTGNIELCFNRGITRFFKRDSESIQLSEIPFGDN